MNNDQSRLVQARSPMGRHGPRPFHVPQGNRLDNVVARFPETFNYLFEPMRYKVAYGGRCSTKAIDVNEHIPTPKGWVRLGDILIGDQVFDEAGQPCMVTEIHDNPAPEQAHRLSFSDGATIDCCGDHEWVTWTHAERKSFGRSPYDDTGHFPSNWPQWRRYAIQNGTPPGYTDTGPKARTTQEIAATLTYGNRGDLNHCIPLCAPLHLDTAELPIEPYVFGYWLANGGARDGNVITGSYDGDFDYPFICEQFAAAGYPLVQLPSGPWISDRLRGELRRHELLANKHLPAVYLRGSHAQRMALLRGLMDGDGTAAGDRGNVSFSNTNPLLADAVFELAVSLGQKATRRTGPAKLYGKDCGECAQVSWRPTLNPFSLPRKAAQVREIGAFGLRCQHRMITAIEPIQSKPMRCLTVDGPNHMYLVSKWMIPTHNSWSYARALLLLGQLRPVRVLCARETMISLGQSVHQLLSDQIFLLGLQDHYDIGQSVIRGRNGTEFKFAGLRLNYAQIKSYEGLNVVWIEEAANVSHMSWETIIPTMRDHGPFGESSGSEIWVTFNPDLETDDTYKRFVINPPSNAKVYKCNYLDPAIRPFFSPALEEEMQQMKAQDYDKYLNIYEGECRTFLEGAIYTDQMKAAAQATDEYPDSRICKVPYNASYPVHATFDLGWADGFAIWLTQKVGFEVHCLKYIQGQRRTLDSYLKELSELPYPIDKFFLPHDAKQKSAASDGKSIEMMMRNKGKTVVMVPNLSVVDGINCVRQTFPNILFDKKNCAVGLHALRHYRYEVIENGIGGFRDVPVHDKYSHANDALRYVCVGLRAPKSKLDPSKYRTSVGEYGRKAGSANGWMAL